MLEPAGGGVPVHPHAERVAQDRPAGRDRRRPGRWLGPQRGQRDEHDLAALAAHAQYPVAVLLAQVGDIRPAGNDTRRSTPARWPALCVSMARRWDELDRGDKAQEARDEADRLDKS